MVKTFFIPKQQRIEYLSIIEDISNSIFGDQTECDFSERYVPNICRVPVPKVRNFANYLLHGPKLLWSIEFELKIVGFVLISDMPHHNSIGFGINSNYSRKGIVTEAWNLIKQEDFITYPLYGYTSKRNIPAQCLLDKLGFQLQNEEINFCGEDSYKYFFQLQKQLYYV